MIGALSRGEKALSWQSPGGALTTCELGNGALCAPFQGSRADAWEEEQRASEQSREEHSGLQNLLRCDESAVSTARDAVTAFG